MRNKAFLSFFLESFRLSLSAAVKAASFSTSLMPFSTASHTSWAPSKAFILMLQLSYWFVFSVGTWKEDILAAMDFFSRSHTPHTTLCSDTTLLECGRNLW